MSRGADFNKNEIDKYLLPINLNLKPLSYAGSK